MLKLKNFAPKILLSVQLIVLSNRNANIVIGETHTSCSSIQKHPQLQDVGIADV